MRRRIAVAVATLALTALTAGLGVAPASAACPNEAFRTGPSAGLAECRAYEQVTPADKESGEGISEFSEGFAAPAGNGIYFSAPSAFAGAQQGLEANPYVALRQGDAWVTHGVGATVESPGPPAFGIVGAVSPDLGHMILASNEALAPGAIPHGSNIYVRDNRTGTYTLVEALPGELQFGGWAISNGNGYFAAAAADYSSVLILNSSGGLSEFREGQLRPAVAEASAAGVGETTPNVMSADGSKFFYVKEGNLYQHLLGQAPLLVSEDGAGNSIGIGGSGFSGASPNGDVAFFTAADGSLYRYDSSQPPGARVTRITPATGLEGNAAPIGRVVVSNDGTTAYLAANAQLTEDAVPGENGAYLYVWREEGVAAGQLRFVPGLSDFSNFVSVYPVSPNGRFLAIQSPLKLTPEVVDGPSECPGHGALEEGPGPCRNVFLYSYDANRTVCVTCNGAPPSGPSRLGGSPKGIFGNFVRPVLDDGMVLFDTANRLMPSDVDGVRDTYAWKDGRLQLVSSGTGANPTTFVGASADGTDLFFQTDQRLVGQDEDVITDLYDARVGGGLASQQAPRPAPTCIVGGGCREGSVPTPPATELGTSTIGGRTEGATSCDSLRSRAEAARKRGRALSRRAARAEGRQARALRRQAARVTKASRRLRRTANSCRGGR